MFKEYEVTVDLDNEIKGKPLRILKADQEFWNNLGSGWLDAQISPEIIKALRGEESNACALHLPQKSSAVMAS